MTGPGLLAVRAYQPGYIASSSVTPELAGKVANPNVFQAFMHNFHGLFSIDPPAEPGSFHCELMLEPGRKQQISVVGPDGKPLAGTLAFGLDWSTAPRAQDQGQFDYVHPNPGKLETVLVLHQGLQLGGFIDVRGDEQGPLKMRLRPTGKVIGRLVDEEGRPRLGVYLSLCYECRDSRSGDCLYEVDNPRVVRTARADSRSILSWRVCVINFKRSSPTSETTPCEGKAICTAPGGP